MIRVWLRIIIFVIVFVLLQVLVINNIHMFGLITPFIYLYVILKIPVNLSRSAVIAISFLLGLLIDLFSDTSGIHAAACSFIGLTRMPLLERLVDFKEMPEGVVPSYKTFGFFKFVRYSIILIAIHHIILFVIESFSFFQPWLLISRMMSSVFFTSLLCFIIEAFNINKVKGGE